MSFSQTFFGAAGLTAVAQLIWTAVAPLSAPLVIHSLSYDSGYIIQDRTISNGGDPVPMVYKAAIVSKLTGQTVPNCEGTGGWSYTDGHATLRIPLKEWVANPLCTLPPGEYQPVAKYETWRFGLTFRGDSFTVTE